MRDASLFEQAYARIQKEILSGSLPPGGRVSEASLSRRLGLGRAPVREALRQLHCDGIVRQIHRYGTIVCVPRRRDIVDLYELREALETFAVGKAVERIRPEQIERLEQLVHDMQRAAHRLKESGLDQMPYEAIQEQLAADMAFHSLLVSASGNRQITDTVRRKRLLGRILASHVMRFDLPMLARVYRFHRRILRAVKKSDAEAARRATAEHVRTGMREMLEHFDRQRRQRDLDEADNLAQVDDTVLNLRRVLQDGSV